MVETRRIFVDMDGVLCDYYAGICSVLGHKPWPYICELGEWNFFHCSPMLKTADQIAPHMDREFYANLDWLPDGSEIITQACVMVGEENVYLLTSPWDTEGCHAGKMDWVKNHLPHFKNKTLIGTPKEACSFPGSVLIDDAEKNCTKFESVANPGRAVLLPRPWNRRHGECDVSRGHVRDLVSVLMESYPREEPQP